MNNSQKIIKRLLDVLFSSILIVFISPLLLMIAILIKLTSKGSIFFKQERLGQHGQPFEIIKFRTMIMNAQFIGDGISIKSENDERITQVGHFLRRTSLDELPQLFNVFKGEMSLIGPRPPLTNYPYDGLKDYPAWTLKRFNIRPGITGLAQIKKRNSISWNKRIEYDLYYIDQYSLQLDINIFFETIMLIIKPKNIY